MRAIYTQRELPQPLPVGVPDYYRVTAYSKTPHYDSYTTAEERRVVDEYSKSAQTAAVLIDELLDDSTISRVEMFKFCRPFFIQRMEWRKALNDQTRGGERIWKPSAEWDTQTYRPEGTPAEIRRIESIWNDEYTCRAALEVKRDARNTKAIRK